MKCPNCGAEVQDGKFCKYCGASLPDPTKRVEVKIDKKVENVAEIKRAEYEAAESKLRQKKMKQDMRKGKAKLWFVLGWIAIALVLFVPTLIHKDQSMPVTGVIGLAMLGIGIVFAVFYGIHKA